MPWLDILTATVRGLHFTIVPDADEEQDEEIATVSQKVRQLLASSVRLPLKMQHTFTCTPHISALEKWSVRFQP